ncbi:hypothetical protein [Massilibacteroides sp.]|uniref:hypothetical protein n=1 Tax=Massilibacteroides sp. TaxID=2034766 RepID=UPI002601ED62|nr:hypothetical protein [Massilibacteroides sp.]MDD4516162.1 hypothetical protein [Massilibacteroides sp.]
MLEPSEKYSKKRSRVLTAMGIIMLVCLVFLGFFAFPTGILLCGLVGVIYGIINKDKPFIKWSAIALTIGLVFVLYTLFIVDSM